MRYNFHEQLAKIRKNPKHILPEDINQPIIDWLLKIGCQSGAADILEAQKSVAYKRVVIANTEIPNADITIQVDAGMVGERKEWEIRKDGTWVITTYKTVKNPNLDKHKPKKGNKNG